EPALEGERFAVERLGLAQLAPELEELRQRDPGVSRGGMEGVRDGLEEGHGLAEKRLGAGVVAPAVADGGEGVEGGAHVGVRGAERGAAAFERLADERLGGLRVALRRERSEEHTSELQSRE